MPLWLSWLLAREPARDLYTDIAEEEISINGSLDGVPDELILIVLEYADFPSFVCLSQTARRYRRIALERRFKTQHNWQGTIFTKFLPTRQWISHSVNSTHSDVPGFLRWSQRGSTLRKALRKDLFCWDCRHHEGSEYDLFSMYALFRNRWCRECSSTDGRSVYHRAWQFRVNKLWSASQCLIKTGRVNFCQHVTWLPPSFAENCPPFPYRRYFLPYGVTCDVCSANIERRDGTRGSFFIRWEIDTSEMVSSYPSPLMADDHRSIMDLMTQRGTPSAVYICPHHDVSDGRFKSIILKLCKTEPLNLLGPAPVPGSDGESKRIRVSQQLGCRYCPTTIQLLVIYKVFVRGTDTPNIELSYDKVLQIEFRVGRNLIFDDTSALIPNLELDSLGESLRHPKLKHLTWCDDIQCGTNRKENLTPILLLEHEMWSKNDDLRRWKDPNKERTLRYLAAGFPISNFRTLVPRWNLSLTNIFGPWP